jgi:hypothetical protein
LFSARERLLQAVGFSGAAPGQSSAMMIDIQSAPEWLRPLLLIFPASQLPLIDDTVSGDSKINGEQNPKFSDRKYV